MSLVTTQRLKILFERNNTEKYLINLTINFNQILKPYIHGNLQKINAINRLLAYPNSLIGVGMEKIENLSLMKTNFKIQPILMNGSKIGGKSNIEDDQIEMNID